MRRNIEQIGQQLRQRVWQQSRQSHPPTVHRSGLMAVLVLESARAFAQSQQPVTAPLEPVRRIVVSIPDRKLALVEDGRVVKIYQVAVGAHVSPTPAGVFTIANRILLPTYYAPGIVLAPGPGNPLGTRWIGLSVKSFGIHGTNQPGSIGRPRSHGCVRMRNSDVEELFERVRAGDRVELVAERTEEIVSIFGGHAAAEPVLSAAANTASAPLAQ
jgi:lipoprotein-anchoring transpeptidase ErfK/SrfK